MQKVLYINQIHEISDYIDKAVIDYIDEGQIETFESFSDFNIIAFDWYDIYDTEAEPSQIMIYIDKDDIFVLCENESSYDKARTIFRQAETNERALYMFFRNMFKGDAKYLEDIEDRINIIDDEIITNKKTDSAEDIVDFRREILRLKKYYEQLDTVFEELCENDNGLISEESLNYFETLKSRMEKLLSSVMNLREYITQVRESYQAQIDIEQNDLMKIFTLVTSIFMPLTLIVGWYGMNFNMPEFTWKHGYLIVIIVSLLVCIIWFAIFRKGKWFK